MSVNYFKSGKIVYSVTTAIVATVFFITGIGNLLPFHHIAQEMAHLGYPAYLLKIIGTWKILAAVVVISHKFRRIKEWAYAGMILDLTGAAFSRYFVGDPLSTIIIPLGLSGFVTLNYITGLSLQKDSQAKANEEPDLK